MENGDNAIKSIGGDGFTWTFDANAPQVSEFQVDKIVFATGRAVGRVLSMKRQADNIEVVLGPVGLTDLIRNGTSEMDAAVNLDNAVSYVAQSTRNRLKKISLNESAPATAAGGQIFLAQMPPEERRSEASHNQHSMDNRRNHFLAKPVLLRAAFQQAPRVPPLPRVPQPPNLPKVPDVPKSVRNAAGVLNTPVPGGQKVPDVADVPYGPSLHLPGVEGISPLRIAQEPFNPPKLMGQLPLVELAGGKAIPLAGSDTSVGMEYDYDKDGLRVRASGKLILGESGIRFFLHISNGGVKDCGMSLKGNMAVKLHLNAATSRDFAANFHKTLFLPIDVSLPLGGPVPLSLTFSSSFVLHTAFSAKGSVLNAKGEYSFGAGLDTGYWAKDWRFKAGAKVQADTDVADSIEGISVGWNSAILGFGQRALVGVGAFGTKAGVFVAVRFTGSAAKAPNITFPCRQGTMDISLETGVDYSLAEWRKDAINFFLRPFTDKLVDRAGTSMKGPVQPLYRKTKQLPAGCIARGS